MEIELGEINDDKKNPFLKVGSDNTFTFLHNEKGVIKMVSKSFDYEIDYLKINICHALISNIINVRKTSFFPGEKVKHAYFDKYPLDILTKPNYTLERAEFTLGELKKKNR